MNKLAANTLRILAILMVAGMTVVLCITLGRGVLFGLSGIPDTLNWKAKTTPLEQSVVSDICLKFALDSDDRRCQPGAVVYAPDFFQDITRTFREHDGVWSTYEQVQAKLGPYQYRLEPITRQADGLAYFVADYDLRGDRVFPISFFCYEDGRVFRIIADVHD